MKYESKEAELAALKARINKMEENPANLKSQGVLNRLRKKLNQLINN